MADKERPERDYDDAECNVMAAVAPDPRYRLHQQVENAMTNHPPVSHHVTSAFEELRLVAKRFAHAIVDICPESREQSLALTHAEEALMFAVAAIARNQ